MITSLHLKNFRNHKDTRLDLARVNVFVGPNGGGKSTIKAAIEYLLTGRCGWTDGRGAGADELIRYGQDKAEIRAEVDGLVVTRTIPGGLAIEGWNGTSTTTQKALYDKLGASDQVIAAVLNTSKFIDLPPGDQKNMLFALMGLEFDREKLQQLLDGWMKAHGTNGITPDGLQEEFAKHCPDNIKGGAEVFDQLDKILREARKAAKKAMKSLETMLQNHDEPELPEGMTVEDLEEAEAQLKELRARRDELIKQKTKAESAAAAAKRAQERIEQLKKAMEAEQQELAALETSPERLRELEAKIPVLEKAVEQEQVQVDKVNEKIHQMTGEVTALYETIQAVKKAGDDCPIAPGTITCPMSKEDRKKLVADLTKKHKKLQKDLEELRQKGHQLATENLTPKKEELRTLKNELEKLKGTGAKELPLRKAIAEKQAMIEAEQMVANTEQPDTKEIELELQQLDERIGKGEKVVSQLNTYRAIAERNQRDRDNLARKQAEVDALEYMVEAFGPKGIKQKMLQKLLGPIQERADRRMEELMPGTRLVFDAEGDFEIKVARPGGTTKIKNLSTSEQMRVGIALQDILNSLTGLGLMVIDDVEHLDPDNKMALMEMFMTLEEYSTVIVMAARGETDPVDPGLYGLAVFEVEDGTVRRAPSTDKAEEEVDKPY